MKGRNERYKPCNKIHYEFWCQYIYINCWLRFALPKYICHQNLMADKCVGFDWLQLLEEWVAVD